jgi:DNA polymerase-3 subunit epsilon
MFSVFATKLRESAMREIVLDTETTGLNPSGGDRIVEIGALEMINHVPTGKTYHVYINPERDIDPEAVAIHGITNERVSGEPIFADLAEEFLEFIADSPLVIHNAPFDMGFINAELKGCDRKPLPLERAIDTLEMARRKFPGAKASLDALCKRFNIDNSHRSLHGAMIDTDLLADVYIELIGGKQPALALSSSNDEAAAPQKDAATAIAAASKTYEKRPHDASADEKQAHLTFIDSLTDPIWRKIDSGHDS